MTARDFMLWFGGVMLALAALAVWRAAVAVRKRARAGQGQRWVGLVFRGLLIAGLVTLGASAPRARSRVEPAPPAAAGTG